MVFRSMRFVFILLCMITGGILGFVSAVPITNGLANLAQWLTRNSHQVPMNTPLTVKLGCLVAGSLVGLLVGSELMRLLSVASRRLEEMEPEETLATVIGIVLGVVVTAVFSPILFQIQSAAKYPLFALVAGVFIYLSVIAANRVTSILPVGSSKGPVRRKAIKILDTNIIIDGRIAEIMRTGFMEGQIYIPRFVLDELQLIADSSDQLRRARGRRGLEILNTMQKEFQLEVGGAHDRSAPDAGEGVDARLVKMAKAIGGDIVTNDYNLNKVAELQGIKVLNVNDLALALKPNVLPGEEMTVLIIRDGKEQNQGVAYLDDGTMVVVEGGRRRINETVDVVVTSVLQTTAGKMIFAEIREDRTGEDDNSIDQSMRAFTRGRSRRPLR